MKKAFFVLIAFAFLIPSHEKAGACEPLLIHDASSQVTYDSLTGRYWYYDLVRFTNMSYDQQMAEIQGIHVDGFPGRWHMATHEEMEELWYHSAETIFSSFALTRDDPALHQQYADGRYDERHPQQAQAHFFAEVRLKDGTTYEKSQLNHNIHSDSAGVDVLGAWVIYEDPSGGPGSPAGKALPAIMLLLSDPEGSRDPYWAGSVNRRPFYKSSK